MSKVLPLLCVIVASAPARAETSIGRIGTVLGVQRTDRSAWVFGPALEVTVKNQLSIRAEALLELGDLGDPFGPSNIRDGSGPHVNHILVGPTWRPAQYAPFALAAGAEVGVTVMHSLFAQHHFTTKPAVGLFVQAGRRLGPVTLALQLRFDLSAGVAMGGPNGDYVRTTSGRINFLFEVPITIQ